VIYEKSSLQLINLKYKFLICCSCGAKKDWLFDQKPMLLFYGVQKSLYLENSMHGKKEILKHPITSQRQNKP